MCPPHLCEQWQRELRNKFNIDAVVVRSGTVSKLERQLPAGDHHIFSYYRHIIVSLDYAKSERRRASFLAHCPDFIIVDEAHTCASPLERAGTSQQQRHQLVQEIAAVEHRSSTQCHFSTTARSNLCLRAYWMTKVEAPVVRLFPQV